MNVAEFHEDRARCKKLMDSRSLLLFGPMLFLLLIGGAATRMIAPTFPLVAIGVIFAAAILAVPMSLFVSRWVEQTWEEFPRLSCIHCDGSLFRFAGLVVITGNCPNCGRRALKDELIGR